MQIVGGGSVANRGHPVDKRKAMIEAIIERVSNGEPLAAVCRDIKLGLTTWYDWCSADPSLAERVARAREAGEEMIAVDVMRIVDEEPSLNVTQFGSSYDSASVTWAKNRAEIRLKLLKCWNPKKWGDKLAMGGADDLPPVQQNVTLDAAEAYKRLIGQ